MVDGEVGLDIGVGQAILQTILGGDISGEGSLEETLIVLADRLCEPCRIFLLLIFRWHLAIKIIMIMG